MQESLNNAIVHLDHGINTAPKCRFHEQNKINKSLTLHVNSLQRGIQWAMLRLFCSKIYQRHVMLDLTTLVISPNVILMVGPVRK